VKITIKIINQQRQLKIRTLIAIKKLPIYIKNKMKINIQMKKKLTQNLIVLLINHMKNKILKII